MLNSYCTPTTGHMRHFRLSFVYLPANLWGSILFADATKKRKPTSFPRGFSYSFGAPLQKTNGTILHLPSKACFPNLPSYHSYVPWAVTPKLTATKTSAQATVPLSH